VPTLATSHTGSKPVPAAARTKRSETADTISAPFVHPCVDARAIKDAAEHLLNLVAAFALDYSANSIAVELRAAGVEEGNDRYLRDIARHLLHDIAGAEWMIETFVMLLSSQIFAEDAGILSPKPR